VSSIYKQAVEMNLENAFSLERFQRYIDWSAGDREYAFELYALNSQLSEALYTPLQILEIVLRNQLHDVLSRAFGECWFDQPQFLQQDYQKAHLLKIKNSLIENRKSVTPGKIIAALTFGFWTGLLASEYESLWQQTTHAIAQQGNGKYLTRKSFSKPLMHIRVLRNRIAHHEPIIHWSSLPEHYQRTMRLTKWLCPAAHDWSAHFSRFEVIYPENGISLV